MRNTPWKCEERSATCNLIIDCIRVHYSTILFYIYSHSNRPVTASSFVRSLHVHNQPSVTKLDAVPRAPLTLMIKSTQVRRNKTVTKSSLEPASRRCVAPGARMSLLPQREAGIIPPTFVTYRSPIGHPTKRSPHVTNRAPHVTNRAPHVTNRAPHVTNRAPHVTNRAPQVTNRAPHVTNLSPIPLNGHH